MPVIHAYNAAEEHYINLRQVLAEQVPDMSRGFTITTCNGEFNIDASFAQPFQELAEHVVTQQLDQARKRLPRT